MSTPEWQIVEDVAFYEEYYRCRLSRAEAVRAVAADYGLTPKDVERLLREWSEATPAADAPAARRRALVPRPTPTGAGDYRAVEAQVLRDLSGALSLRRRTTHELDIDDPAAARPRLRA